MKRVVLVHDSNVYGGMEVHMRLVLQHLDRRRYCPAVLIPGYTEPDYATPQRFVDEVQALDVPIVRPPHPGMQAGLSFWRDVAHIRALLRANRTDVVHVHTNHPKGARKATLAATLAGVQAIVRTEHLPPSAFGLRPGDVYQAKLFDWMNRRIITVSEYNRREQIGRMRRSRHQVICVYNGIDLTHFRPTRTIAAAKQQLGFDPAVPLIGTVGRLNPQKGLCYLLAAAAQVIAQYGNLNLVLVGDGPLEQALRAQAADLGIAAHVHFAGYQAATLPYIEALDIAVIPSIFEGGPPLSLMECMALGKACVVSDYPSIGELVRADECGLMVPTQNSAALGSAIITLMHNHELAARLGRAARRRISESFTVERNVATMMNLYDSLLNVE